MRAVVVGCLLVLVLAGCSETDPGEAAPSGVPSESSSQAPSAPTTSEVAPSEPAPDPDDTLPPVRDRVSLAALMRQPLDGGRLRQQQVIGEAERYTRSTVTYRSDGLAISGVLLRPRGRGPFPAIVLNHGYIEPSAYVTGQGLAREQEWLANAGFVVLHTDYRGHAGSDAGTEVSVETRLGYTRDAANAVDALVKEPYVDGERVAMLGRSMGGGVTQNVIVAYPDLVDAAVVYASVSSDQVENLEQFTAASRPDVLQRLTDRYGTPEEEPAFYAGLSARTHFDRIEVPVQIHHGTADEVCPFRWARATDRLMRRAGVATSFEVYDGEQHAFIPQWEDSIRRTVRFLRRNLD